MSQPQMLDETAVVDPAVAWFALPPLSVTLLSGTALVRPYSTGANPPLGGPAQSRTFTGVDVDVWLLTALGAVEQVLTSAVDADSGAALGLLKPRLAAVLAARAEPLFVAAAGETVESTAAVAAVERSLLASLTNAGTAAAASTELPVGTVVPAPLCAFPEPARLITQQARQSVAEPTTAADLVAWQLSVVSENPGHPQDAFALDVFYNTQPMMDESPLHAVGPAMQPVFTCLAEFATAWPALQQDLAGESTAGPAVAALTTLLTDLTAALAVLPQAASPRSAAVEPIVVPGGTVTVSFEVDGLSVLREASALAGVSVIRNHDLLPGRTTNPAFVYRGPVTRFTSEVVPTISGAAPIAIEGESVGAALGRFLQTVLHVPDHGLLAHRPRLRLAGTFCGTDGRRVELPIFLVPTYPFRPASDWDWTAPGSFVAGIGHTVEDWLQAQRVGAGGTIRFDLTVFSGDGRPKPLIQDVTLTYPLPTGRLTEASPDR